MSEQSEKNGGILIRQEQERANEFRESFLDMDQERRIVHLTQDNAVKIEALIHFNPRYSNTVDKNNTKSAMALIKKLKEKDSIYTKDQIQGIIERINFENSTRMSDDEMKEIARRVFECANTKEDLFDKLKSKDYPLICIIADNVETTNPKNGKKRNRVNFSFATKFCHYMCFYLFEGEKDQDNYSIYDNIVINVIPEYEDMLGIEPKELLPFNKKTDKGNNASKYYSKFQKRIDAILDKNYEDHRVMLSRYTFDHILWYSSKTVKKST